MGKPTKDNVEELLRVDREFGRQVAKEAAAEFDDVRTWIDPGGHRLSDRVWDARQQVRSQIDQVLRDAVANRTDALVVAKQLEQFLNPAYALARGPDGRVLKNQPRGVVTTAPGRGGQGSYAARRLARTEISRAHAQQTQKASGLTPFSTGWQWNVSSSHPRPDECDDHADRDEGLGPGVYPPNGGPRMPSHPLCLCYATIFTNKDIDAVVASLRDDYDLNPDYHEVEPRKKEERFDQFGTRTVTLPDLAGLDLTGAVTTGTDLGKTKKLLDRMVVDIKRTFDGLDPDVRKGLEEGVDKVYRQKRKELGIEYKKFLKSRPDTVKKRKAIKRIEIEGPLTKPLPKPPPEVTGNPRIDAIRDAIERTKDDIRDTTKDTIAAVRDVKTIGKMIREEADFGRQIAIDEVERLEKRMIDIHANIRDAPLGSARLRKLVDEESIIYNDLLTAQQKARTSMNGTDVLKILRKVRDGYGESIESLNLSGGTPLQKQLLQKQSRFFPKEWWDKMTQSRLKIARDNRASFDAIDDIIAVNPQTPEEVLRHELSHFTESRFRRIGQLEEQFYQDRTQGEDLRKLGGGYRNDEVYRPDRWYHSYVGKDYRQWFPGDVNADIDWQHWEILSMGVEEMFKQTRRRGFIEDTEFVDFILGILATV